MADQMFPPVHRPSDLRQMSLLELKQLSEDIRQEILSTCLRNGGHLGASLGAVELAISLHYCFESPGEPLIWDVGHQAYAHKLLTGRWKQFAGLRIEGGVSGFPSREENEHDVFGTGHSSTALSAGLAMAWARKNSTQWTATIVGDGGLTAGLSFEALNNFRGRELGPFLLLLNDNQMSISQSVGAMSTILSGPGAKDFFELFGFDYIGPVDGHDLAALIATFQGIKEHYAGRPVVVHARTQKGRGYIPAEEHPTAFHGVNPIFPNHKIVEDKIPEQRVSLPRKAENYSDVFGECLCALAEADPKIVAITAAMPEGTGLGQFARRFPDRFFDVGIAEPHAVTFAAGLATQGLRPVVAIYSTFLQRALDGVIHDVALQRLGVTFALDRAGIVGGDGATHHGAFDLSFMGMIPNLRISSPACPADLPRLLSKAVESGVPWAIRYPRGTGPAPFQEQAKNGIRWHRQVKAPKVIVVALGTTSSVAIAAVELLKSAGNAVTVLSTTEAKPISAEVIEYVRAHPAAALVTTEMGAVRGGFGQALVAAAGPRETAVSVVGFGDHFITHGAPAALEAAEGLSAEALATRLRPLL
ncbi:MAG TPA: 1-deoxy-D-xylulose-5-phosphate synthase [Bdellovibrionota bacterium]|nr:1-deoxy-D-xylulose-5-phosphate synthase [Bdellovibrionota bacterium]